MTLRTTGSLGAAALSLSMATAASAAVDQTTREKPAVVLDVPFLPQPPELCGGAAAAMVRRYWGEVGVYAEDYRPLVDPDLGGITTERLAGSFHARGWSAIPIRASREDVERQLSMGRPLIALLGTDPRKLHYVVLAGRASGRFVVHDPALGPWRLLHVDEVFASWETAGFWALLVLPPAPGRKAPAASPSAAVPRSERPPTTSVGSLCRRLVGEAVDLGEDTDAAFERLSTAAALCPGDALVARELAALRFRGGEWLLAAAAAEASVRLDDTDEHAWSLLGASRFLSGDPRGALKAWNVAGKPELDSVEIHGLARSRQDVVYRQLALTPGTELTPDALDLARRRGGELPTVRSARVSFQPMAGGRAKVVAHLAERELTSPFWPLVARSFADAVVDREGRVELNSPTRGGEELAVRGRWWRGRPAVSVSLAAPRMLGLPGVATLSGYAEKQSYALPTGESTTEERRGGRLDIHDWITATTRATVGLGVDHWRAVDTWVFARGAVDQRLFQDRLSLRADLARWFPAGASSAFGELGVSALTRLRFGSDWTLHGRLDARKVGREAPFGVWPGAGTGRARSLLLRGQPLLAGSVVSGEAFAPALLHGSLELERIAWKPGWTSLGIAGFYDWARTSGHPDRAPGAYSSVGIGVRLHAANDVLRVDGAIGRDGRFTLSAGWVESW